MQAHLNWTWTVAKPTHQALNQGKGRTALGTRRLAAMAGSFGSIFRNQQAKHAPKPNRSIRGGQREASPRRLSVVRVLILTPALAALTALAMLPLASTASAQGTWTVTLNAPTGGTTTGFVANGHVTPDGEAGFVQIAYEPTGTPITSSSPTAGQVIFSAGVNSSQTVSMA